MELWRLLAHNHWFTLKVLGREVRLCARCSGYMVGLLASMGLHGLIGFDLTNHFSVGTQVFICLLSVLPLASDWLTQSWGWRESNNSLRFLTGAILGVGIFLFSRIDVTHSLRNAYYVYTAIAIALFGLVGEFLDKPLSNPIRV
jgi:uncharacterized membrane protein